jgi:hypothetical protein
MAGVLQDHWKTSAFMAALRCDGVTVPCVIDGAMTGELFRAYVEKFPPKWKRREVSCFR